MAVPHLSITSISRSTGASALERAAYRHAAKMASERDGPTKNYAGKAEELKHSEISLPANAPAWAAKAYGEASFLAALQEVLEEASQGRIVV